MANYFDTGILLTAGFSLSSSAPLDGRSVVELLTDLDTHIAENRAYEGMCVYVKENKKIYIFNGTTWEEFVGGGSSEPQIKDWVSGSSYLTGDYIYHEGEIYRCLTSNNDIDFDEANWIQVTYGIDELSKEDVEGLLGLTKEEIEAMANLIADTEVRLDKTYSSSKIYQDIQQCLNDSKTFTLLELSKFSGVSYKIVASTSEMTSESIIYLLANGNTYDMYIVEENGATTKIGNMDVNLDNYFTKTEIDNDFLKKVDADGKYATIATVENKIDKDKIVTVLDDSATDEQVASALLTKNELGKINNNLGEKADVNKVAKKIYIKDVSSENARTLIQKHWNEFDRFEFYNLHIDTAKWTWNAEIYAHTQEYGTVLLMSYGSDVPTVFYGQLYNGVWTWKGLSTVDNAKDVGVTTITPVNSPITGTIEYTVKNGICYVSLIDVKSTTNSNGLSIITTMPKPAINSRSPIFKQVGNGNIGIVYINKNTTQLTANIYISDIIGDCSFSYPVAE